MCTDIDGGNAERTAKEILAAGGEAIGFKTDVARKVDTDAMAQRSKDQYDRIDILVNNAAMFTALPEGPVYRDWGEPPRNSMKGRGLPPHPPRRDSV